ncbi:MAG: hypothetical protein QOH71_1957 [Blastocatellia bacterium]|jgi:hypothetical protein|nr:hypothetical protein [Blastocatellia bacterium]
MWELYDYLNERGDNEIAEWTRTLQKPQRIKLRVKLDTLAQAGPDLPPGLLMKTEVEYIYKLKVQGNPKLRPMLCFGPFGLTDVTTGKHRLEHGFTLLVGAKEISWKYEPKDADIEAGIRRVKVLTDPKRRCKHERIN